MNSELTAEGYKENDQWDLILEPRRSIFQLNLKEIWRYRDLLLLFVKRDFTAQYKQTILGPLWHLLQPVFTTVMFMLVFSKIANIPTDGIKAPLFYMSGITIWNYFATCLNSTANTFIANAGIFGKVYFPRMVLPLSVILSNIIRFGIQFILLLSVMTWYHFNGYPIIVTTYWLLLPVLVIMMAGLALGLGIIISSVTTKYRDFTVLLGFAVQLAMYASPVAYSMTYLKSTSYRWIIELNPLSAIIEAFRFALFNKGELNMNGLLYSFCFMVVSLLLGTIMFNKVEKTFMDTV